MLSQQIPFIKTTKFSRVVFLILGLSVGAATTGWAQLSSFHAQYFQDQYLVNPAMAGIEGGLKINTGYQLVNTNSPGSPNAKFGTAEYAFDSKASLGILVNSDQAGLIGRTRIMGTYAYHLPLNETDKLSFGLSVGINTTYFQSQDVVGDQGDQSGAEYNARPAYVDGDFGIAYTGNQLNVQASVPNMRSLFFKSNDRSLAPYRSNMYTSLSYKIPLSMDNNSTTIEPKVAYRGFKSLDGVVDMGVNVSFLYNHLNLSGMYHTNQTMTIAAGLGIKQVGFVFSYTNDMGPFSTYAANTFEFGLKFNLLEAATSKR